MHISFIMFETMYLQNVLQIIIAYRPMPSLNSFKCPCKQTLEYYTFLFQLQTCMVNLNNVSFTNRSNIFKQNKQFLTKSKARPDRHAKQVQSLLNYGE